MCKTNYKKECKPAYKPDYEPDYKPDNKPAYKPDNQEPECQSVPYQTCHEEYAPRTHFPFKCGSILFPFLFKCIEIGRLYRYPFN